MGIAFAIPVTLAYLVVSFLLHLVDHYIGGWCRVLITAALPHWLTVHFVNLPGLSCLILLLGLVLLGGFLSTPPGRKLRGLFDTAIGAIPIVGAIYHVGCKIVSLFTQTRNSATATGTRVVTFHPYGKVAAISDYAFVTDEWVDEGTGEEMVQLFVPGKPIPSSGNTFSILKSATWDANITMQELILYSFTMGIKRPKTIRARIHD